MGGHKVDMRTYESVLFLDGANAVRPSDGGTGINTSQFLLPLGNLLVTGGVGPDQGMAIWAHQADPDLRGPEVGYHVPRAGRTNYPVGAPISLLIHETLETTTLVNGVSFIVRPVGGSPVDGRLTFAFDDILTFTPSQPLAEDTTYEVVLPAGGIKDAAGNGMVGYSFTFSTGSAVGGNAPPVVDDLTASLYPASPGQSVTLTAVATDPEGGPLEYRFDFGDGSPQTAWASSASAARSYAEEGHFRATVQVRDGAGSLASGAVTVTVVVPPAGPRPTSSAPVVCDAVSRRVWAVNPDNDSVSAMDADSLALLLESPVCDDPRSLAVAPSGELWVACHDDDSVRILDAGGSEVAEIATGYGSAPAAVVLSPDGTSAFVSLQGSGRLLRFDTATRQETGNVVLGDLMVGTTPRALAVAGDGSRVYVTRFRSPDEHAEVWEIETTGFTLARTLRLPKLGGEANRDGTASGRGVPNYLTGVALAPAGDAAWVVSNKPNSERGPFFAEDLDQDNTVRNLATRIDLGTGEVATSIDLDNSDSASAVAFSPLGDYAFVALQGNNEILVLDALRIGSASGLGSLVARLGTGLAPQGVCLDPPTGRTFVKSFMERSVTVLETDGLLRTGDKSLARTDVATVGSESLPPEVLLGKQIFYNAGDLRMSAEGYISCATCHLDGGHDGRVWDFNGRGEGFRNTTSLRGRAGMEHGNVHWSANFDEIQDFENDIRGAFGGTGFMTNGDFGATSDPLGPAKGGLSAELDALAAYVASLAAESVPRSPFRAPGGSMSAEAAAGKVVFTSTGCSGCHAGPRFTDSTLGTATLHDVGTLRTSSGGRLGGPLPGIDTPTLLGVWSTAPYFHDGSAEVLEDVFVVAGGEMLQAEDGTPSSGAYAVTQYVDLNNDDTVHNRAYVALHNTGATLTLDAVDGGSGGVGALELRYSTGQAQALTVTVNGTPYPVLLEDTGNDPGWRHTSWKRVRIEDVILAAGPANQVAVSTSETYPNVSLDDVLVTTADERAAAAPHRVALSLSMTDREALLAYLRQLDGRPEVDPLALLFADGFESGDTGAWSGVVD